MSPKHPVVYEPLVFDQRPSPPRSRLYHLEPIGIGSPLTESFTSYLARLAHAHHVGPWTLIKEEILPVTKQSHLTGTFRSTLGHWAQALNGLGSQARRWVEAVGHLTGRQDLHWLTMLPWEHVVPSRELVRSERAWCAQCLRAWRASAREVYEPLLWTLQCVSVCSIHEEPLQLRCPHRDCGRRLPPLHAYLLPGQCSHCLRRLDHRQESRPSHRDHDQTDWAQALRAAKAVGDLIAAAPMLQALLGRDRLAQALRSVCQAVSQGNGSAVARLAGFPSQVVNCWMHGRTLPQLGSLVQLCDRIGTTPLALLRDGGHTPGLLRICPDKASQRSRAGRRRWRRFPVVRVRAALEAVLADRQSPPPSLTKVAAQLGYDRAFLRRRFRDLCLAISAQHRRVRAERAKQRIEELQAKVCQATRTLVQQGLNPTRYRVARYLRKPDIFLAPRVTEAWRMTLKDLGVTLVDGHRKPSFPTALGR